MQACDSACCLEEETEGDLITLEGDFELALPFPLETTNESQISGQIFL